MWATRPTEHPYTFRFTWHPRESSIGASKRRLSAAQRSIDSASCRFGSQVEPSNSNHPSWIRVVISRLWSRCSATWSSDGGAVEFAVSRSTSSASKLELEAGRHPIAQPTTWKSVEKIFADEWPVLKVWNLIKTLKNDKNHWWYLSFQQWPWISL